MYDLELNPNSVTSYHVVFIGYSELSMPNIASVLKQEISRVARKEVRGETQTLRKQVSQYRSQIAALKRRLEAVEKQGRKQARTVAAAPERESSQDEQAGLRFRAKGFAAHRQRLGLSAREMALLLGVSQISVYNWEQGKARPRASQLASIAAVRKLGKREAAAKLAHVD